MVSWKFILPFNLEPVWMNDLKNNKLMITADQGVIYTGNGKQKVCPEFLEQ